MKIYLVSLGCSKNLVDSEYMLGALRCMGHEFTDNPYDAEVIVINTCGFLESAVEEAIETILELAVFKEKGSCKKLIVCGCMVQRYGKKLVNLLPEVDYFLGVSHFNDIVSAVASALQDRILISHPRFFSYTRPFLRQVSTPSSFAYLKIAEGCSNKCAFCYIPKIRGPLRSRPLSDILTEAKFLDGKKISELVLIAQDIASFGRDWGDSKALIKLLSLLEKTIRNIKWIRILYAHPDNVNEDLIRFMKDSEKVVPYLDIPFQHCSYRLLKAMGRKGAGLFPEKVVEKVRSIYPEIAIRTTFIVGFPGETQRDFMDLKNFVEKMEFDHVGVFSYSPERGTRAATFPDQIPDPIKEDRRLEIYNVQKEISRRKLKRFVNKTLDALVDGLHPECEYLLTGRLKIQAPEVDGKVIFTDGTAKAGEIVSVRITRVHEYDLEGCIIEI